jgi:hypothetical protein
VRAGGLAATFLATVAFLALAGCGDAPPTTPTPMATAVMTPDVVATPAPASTASPAATRPPVGAVMQDPTLLEVLPESIDGVPIALEAQAFTDAAADPAFAGSIEAAAFAVLVDGGDLASGVVARPVPGHFSEAFFRDWRDTYNEGACAQAGGVAANAEAELGGRTVYIATCAGGLRTYHAYLEEPGLVVSLLSLGERRFGEQLMAGIRP